MALESFETTTGETIEHKNVTLAAGDKVLVTAEAGKRIKVFRFMLSGDAVVRFTLYSGSKMIFTFYGMEHFGVPLMSVDEHTPIFITNSGEALMLNASGAVHANVYLQYKVE